MNPQLVKEALAKVVEVHVLVNLVSRRVRQLNFGGGGSNRPLLADTGHLRAADIALREIIEGKISFDLPEFIPLTRPTGRNRNGPKHWTKM